MMKRLLLTGITLVSCVLIGATSGAAAGCTPVRVVDGGCAASRLETSPDGLQVFLSELVDAWVDKVMRTGLSSQPEKDEFETDAEYRARMDRWKGSTESDTERRKRAIYALEFRVSGFAVGRGDYSPENQVLSSLLAFDVGDPRRSSVEFETLPTYCTGAFGDPVRASSSGFRVSGKSGRVHLYDLPLQRSVARTWASKIDEGEVVASVTLKISSFGVSKDILRPRMGPGKIPPAARFQLSVSELRLTNASTGEVFAELTDRKPMSDDRATILGGGRYLLVTDPGLTKIYGEAVGGTDVAGLPSGIPLLVFVFSGGGRDPANLRVGAAKAKLEPYERKDSPGTDLYHMGGSVRMLKICKPMRMREILERLMGLMKKSRHRELAGDISSMLKSKHQLEAAVDRMRGGR